MKASLAFVRVASAGQNLQHSNANCSKRTSPLLALGLCASLTSLLLADPCGMVPPITPGGNVPIARVGYQQTYVFYESGAEGDKGLETFVIRPGFTGKVEEFGMLIPFPAVPSLRKVPDAVFEHLAKAVDPPEVVVYAGPQTLLRSAASGAVPANRNFSEPALQLANDAVRVVKQEAVGMYEVTVLEAGSPKALKLWMDDHEYVYPEGMDDACADYIEQKWCFVAVKTKVADKSAADPQPGQRALDVKLPDGASFDGFVQAMGFRFEVDELVVPMRLSTFNAGDLHNVVYVLADDPLKIDNLPQEFVVRQVPGSELLRNVTQPLPLRVIGGEPKDIPDWRRKNLKQERDPEPHNGVAKALFAGDLLASKEDRLSHPHEEAEKMLLMIGERLGLRGEEIDAQNAAALKQDEEAVTKAALDRLAETFTLTVIDGNFPRPLLASQNLSFEPYRMPGARNSSEFYNAVEKKPVTPRKDGRLIYGELSASDTPAPTGTEQSSVTPGGSRLPWGSALLLGSAVLTGLVLRRRR